MEAPARHKLSMEGVKLTADIYKDLITKRPILSMAVAVLSTAIYLMSIINPPSNPLNIMIHQTEVYKVEGSNFSIQRINITTEALVIRDVEIRVELPMAVEFQKLDSTPHVSCSMTANKFGDDRRVFAFRCSSFDDKRQRLELTFGTTKKKAIEALVLVQVTGIGAKGQRVLEKQRGMFWGR